MYIHDKGQFPKLSGIYKITNLSNNKFYIGSAINLDRRLKRHYYELSKRIHSNKHLQRAYNKVGSSMFKVDFLETFESIDSLALLTLEKSYIIQLNAIKSGYNLMVDNSQFLNRLNRSLKHIEKVSESLSKEVYAMSIETGELEYKFKSVSDCSRFFNTSSSNISRVCRGILNYIKGYTYCYASDYDSNKNYRRSTSKKGQILKKSHILNLKKAAQSTFGKITYKYDLNYNLLEIYASRAEAERVNKLDKESLRRRIDKETPFGGYYWLSEKI
jgi:excinuclease UvrABC nuclease subunit